jgi:hypothetical protein
MSLSFWTARPMRSASSLGGGRTLDGEGGAPQGIASSSSSSLIQIVTSACSLRQGLKRRGRGVYSSAKGLELESLEESINGKRRGCGPRQARGGGGCLPSSRHRPLAQQSTQPYSCARQRLSAPFACPNLIPRRVSDLRSASSLLATCLHRFKRW